MDEVCDYLQLVPENIDWNAVNKHKLVNTAFEEITMYRLQRLEKNADGDYVMTRDHLLSLVFEYIGIHHACILGYDNIHSRPEVKKSTDELKITTLQTMRGVTINKDVLSNDEVHELLQYLNISNDTLKSIVVSKPYLRIMQDTAHQLNVESETSVFQTSYAFIQDTDRLCDNSINSVFKSNIELPLPQLPSSPRDFWKSPNDFWKSSNLHNETKADNADETDTLSHTVVYNNVIDDSLNMFDIELVHLREFNKVSSLTYRDVVTKSVLDTINKTQISDKLVQELKQLVTILEHWDQETTNASDDMKTWSVQKIMTKSYVDNHKNDAMETLASTVIDNVCDYLQKSSVLRIDNINKNQIGTDLVDLGVKKTRKAKGYVYGIEDTSKSYVLHSI
jgi:hypothetical protein